MTPICRATLGAVIGLALIVGVATTAFACTYIPHLYAVAPTAGSPGTDISLEGSTAAGVSAVTVRWNGLRGQVLATVTPDSQGNFKATVKVPTVSPGMYFVVADAGGTDVARAPFQVTGSAGAKGVLLPQAAAPDTATSEGATSLDTSSAGASALFLGLLFFAVVAVGAVSAFGFVLTRRRVPTRVR